MQILNYAKCQLIIGLKIKKTAKYLRFLLKNLRFGTFVVFDNGGGPRS